MSGERIGMLRFQSIDNRSSTKGLLLSWKSLASAERVGDVKMNVDRQIGSGNAVSYVDLITQQWRYERQDVNLTYFLFHMYVVRLGRIFEQLSGQQCQQRFGLRIPDIRVLMALRRGGRPYAKRPTDLFKSLLVTSGAMTKQVDRLAKLDLVERIPDPAFRGGFLITLTRKGLALVDEVVTGLASESVIAPAMGRLSHEELESGMHFVRRVLNEMEAMTANDLTSPIEGEMSGEKPSMDEVQTRRRPNRRAGR